ncbi:MAG: RNase P modulator RnpM [Dehalococcoidia bacterium]
MKNSTTRRQPQRTCVACRRTGDKGSLVRVVRTDNGTVEVDLSSKKAGRGAYLCPKRECWQVALKKNRIEYNLRARLSDENRRALSAYSEGSLEESRT